MIQALSAGTGFNGAALGRARRYSANPRDPNIPPGFNGAALGRARRFGLTSLDLTGQGAASTGPRSGERGDRWPPSPYARHEHRFNGAALGRARR